MSAAIVGPWGGKGGDAFDDGWSNEGVSSITLYYTDILRGFQVVYGNAVSKLHGEATGTSKEISFGSAGAAAADIAVGVGSNSAYFSGDPNGVGVVALGVASSATPTLLPSTVTVTGLNRPQVLGFFGASGTNVDRLGLYLSN